MSAEGGGRAPGPRRPPPLRLGPPRLLGATLSAVGNPSLAGVRAAQDDNLCVPWPPPPLRRYAINVGRGEVEEAHWGGGTAVKWLIMIYTSHHSTLNSSPYYIYPKTSPSRRVSSLETSARLIPCSLSVVNHTLARLV